MGYPQGNYYIVGDFEIHPASFGWLRAKWLKTKLHTQRICDMIKSLGKKHWLYRSEYDDWLGYDKDGYLWQVIYWYIRDRLGKPAKDMMVNEMTNNYIYYKGWWNEGS